MAIGKCIWGAGFALAAVTAAGATTPGFPDAAVGDWSGTVQLRGAQKHLFVHIHKTQTGDYAATLDSPEHRAGAIPATPIAAPEGILAFTADGGQFRGAWSDANGRWEGVWTEAGSSAPMTLSFNDNNSSLRLRSKDGTSPAIELPRTGPRVGFPPEVVPPSAR